MLQDPLQSKYTGGTVQHIYLGEQVSDIETVKALIKKTANNFRLPYFTLTPTFSVCPTHGYLKGEQPECSICQRETEVYSRVVGYLRPIKQWNDGKQAEFFMRKNYTLSDDVLDESVIEKKIIQRDAFDPAAAGKVIKQTA